MKVPFRQTELSCLQQALMVAADQYDRGAGTVQAAEQRLVDQFKRLAIEARALCAYVETLEPGH